MTVPEPVRDELFDLLWSINDGKFSPGDVARLEELVDLHPEASQLYAQYSAMCGLLSWERKNNPAVHSAREESSSTVDSSVDDNVSPFNESPVVSKDEPSCRHAFSISTQTPYPTSQFVGGPVFSYMVATVAMCAMLLGAWAYTISHSNLDTIGANTRQSTPHDVGSELEFVGRVTNMKDCRWAKNAMPTMVGAHVPLKRKYELASGLLELTYDCGAKVILEGPCEYGVDSTAGGRLQQGKLVALVEKRGERREERKAADAKLQAANSPSLIPNPQSLFCITTPTAVVTDLGTEFGVEVNEPGDTVSHVFQGSVKVRAIGGNGLQEDVVLHENESVRVSKADGEGKPSITRFTAKESSRFVRNMPLPKLVRDSNAYARMVLSMRPVVYYRMERPKNGTDSIGATTNAARRRPSPDRSGQLNISTFSQVLDSSGGGHHGELRLGNESGQPYQRGRWGDAISLRGPEIGDYMSVSDYPKAAKDKLSVSVWVKVDRWMTKWPSIVANRGDTQWGQFNVGLCDQGAGINLAVFVTPPTGKGQSRALAERRLFPRDKWQHVAFVVNGTKLRLYRNGEEVRQANCDGLWPNMTAHDPEIDDDTPGNDVDPIPGCCWHGMIDELAVFNAALSVEQIQMLYTGKQSVRPFPEGGDGPNDAGETKRRR